MLDKPFRVVYHLAYINFTRCFMFRQLTFDYDLDHLCNGCWIRPIEVRGLCKRCYGRNRRTGSVFSPMTTHAVKPKRRLNHYVPKARHGREWYSRQAIKRYGPEIINDLNDLKVMQHWTLQNVADKYGFTREYVRQLFSKVTGRQYSDYVKEKRANRLHRPTDSFDNLIETGDLVQAIPRNSDRPNDPCEHDSRDTGQRDEREQDEWVNKSITQLNPLRYLLQPCRNRAAPGLLQVR